MRLGRLGRIAGGVMLAVPPAYFVTNLGPVAEATTSVERQSSGRLEITVAASSNVANDITVEPALGGVLVRDAADSIGSPGGCQVTGAHTAFCPIASLNETVIVISAGAGDDIVRSDVAAKFVSIEGGLGNDILELGQSSGPGELFGDAGADSLLGGPHDDRLTGGPGADVHNGGAGVDLVDYEDHSSSVVADLDGEAGDDGSTGERDTIGVDVEQLRGSSGNDTLTGNGSDNILSGVAGTDSLRGLSGKDLLVALRSGGGLLEGGSDDDFLCAVSRCRAEVYGDNGISASEQATSDASAPAVLRGGDGNDVLVAADTADTLDGGDGDDRLFGGEGRDDLLGGAGIDTVSYTDHFNAITADLDSALGDDGSLGEHDTIRTDVENLVGSVGDDLLIGNNGANALAGYYGDDVLRGGDDSDLLIGGQGSDDLDGGAGVDLVSYVSHTEPVTADLDDELGDDGAAGERDRIRPNIEGLRGGQGNDRLDGNQGPNLLIGDDGADTIYGLEGADDLRGGNGSDHLDGNEDDDTLLGDSGDDVLIGGPGDDLLQGGRDSDLVDYSERTRSIKAVNDGVADDGEPDAGERDNVGRDVEGLVGGRGDDTLAASGVRIRNVIRGGAGNDVISVKDADDVVGDVAIGDDGPKDACLIDSSDTTDTCELDGTKSIR